MSEHADIVVVGGGPVGAAVALALAGSGLEVLVLEARAGMSASVRDGDERPLALSHGSRLILERLGVWDALSTLTPIERIHISQAGGFGRVLLEARDTGLPAYGYVVHYGELAAALVAAARRTVPRYLDGTQVTAVQPGTPTAAADFVRGGGACGAARGALVVVADGGGRVEGQDVRQRDYGQCALTARISAERPHRATAYERFTRHGPLALLPAGEELALVWTTLPERAAELQALNERAFLDALQHEFGGRLGRFTAARARAVYPLTLKVMREATQPHVVFVGNAAQTLHPVAGQGFNLGLRDAWELAEVILATAPECIGDEAMMKRLRQRRTIDRRGSVLFTDFLVRVFSNDLAPLRAARGAGLALLDALPVAKHVLARRMTFGARG
jgi:2-octaprenyl-6-methoxyphenol hydroxylase